MQLPVACLGTLCTCSAGILVRPSLHTVHSSSSHLCCSTLDRVHAVAYCFPRAAGSTVQEWVLQHIQTRLDTLLPLVFNPLTMVRRATAVFLTPLPVSYTHLTLPTKA